MNGDVITQKESSRTENQGHKSHRSVSKDGEKKVGNAVNLTRDTMLMPMLSFKRTARYMDRYMVSSSTMLILMLRAMYMDRRRLMATLMCLLMPTDRTRAV